MRPLAEDELGAFVDITVSAYPGMRAMGAEERERYRARSAASMARGDVRFCGAFEHGWLVGVMCMHDFEMQLLSSRTLVGGVGQIGVDLRHKRRRVALELMRYFLDHYRERGAPLAALYPFRHDFYRRMGFGYGTPLISYRVTPSALRSPGGPADVDYLGPDDLAEVAATYDRTMARTNGLFARPAHAWQTLLSEPRLRVVGVRREGAVGGYLIAQFQPTSEDNFLAQDLIVREMAYDGPDDLARLLSFLRSQADQVDRVVVNTADEAFPFLLEDPRDDSGRMLPKVVSHQTGVQGLGIMYRVLGIPRLFEVLADHHFGSATVRLALVLSDDLVVENARPRRLTFEAGRLTALDEDVAKADVTLAMGIADFSSMVVGAVGLGALARVGLARISEPAWTDALDRLFAAPKPICWSDF